jgi:hypothetical protein
VVQIEQMRAHLKGLSARIVMSSEVMVTAPVAYSLIRPKSHIFNIGHDGTLSFRNFIMMVKIFKNHNFEPLATMAYGHNPAKVPKFQNRA